MTNIGSLMGDGWENIKKIGTANSHIEKFGDASFTTPGASVLAKKLTERFSERFEVFCKKRHITKEDALERIDEKNSDADFIAQILPFLVRDIPLTEKSDGAYHILIKELGIPEEQQKDAFNALKIAGSIKLDRLFG